MLKTLLASAVVVVSLFFAPAQLAADPAKPAPTAPAPRPTRST